VLVAAESADHSVVVSVEDDGAGISSEVRPHLFEPFATAGKRHGMGLGLAADTILRFVYTGTTKPPTRRR